MTSMRPQMMTTTERATPAPLPWSTPRTERSMMTPTATMMIGPVMWCGHMQRGLQAPTPAEFSAPFLFISSFIDVYE